MDSHSHMAVQVLPVDDLIPYARNARTHSPEQVAEIAASIKEFGFNNPVLLRDDKTIIAGHGRVMAARKLGLREVPCIYLSHLTEAQARAYVLADNQLATHAGWETEMLKLELDDLSALGFEPGLLGFGDDDLAALSAKVVEATDVDAEPQIDKAEELRVKWGVETGQLWRLGDHRLLCGDSTSGGDVECLMDGERADLCLTDPPYGIGYSYESHDDTDNEENSKLVRSVFALAPQARIWTPGKMNLARELAFYPKAKVLCWHKKFSAAGNGLGGASTWEPVLVDGVDGGRLANDYLEHLTDREPGLREKHPCPKPVSLWSELVLAFSSNSALVYEPFSGSGTTIIACEQLGRKCRAIEISPGYVAVALQRWADATGKTPELISG